MSQRPGLAVEPAPHSVKRLLELGPTAQLGLAAACIGLFLGLVFVAPEPIWAGQPLQPPPAGAVPTPGVGWPGVVVALAFVLGLVVPFRPYWHALRLASGQVGVRATLALTAALAGIAWLMYPRFGSDVFEYLGFERMWVVYGDNPLLGLPAAHPQDWSTALVWFRDQPPAYGPLWAALGWPLVRLAGDSAPQAVLGYKLLAAAGYAACCGLIWLSVEPARRLRALVAFAWSPLVLFEVLGKAHNDVLVALSMLTAIWLIGQRRGLAWTGVPALALGGLIKVSALGLLPALAIGLWRRAGRRQLVLAGGLAIGLIVAAYAPFWAGLPTLQPIWHQTGRLVWSPGSLLILLGGPTSAPLVRTLGGVAWLVAGGVLLRRTRRASPAVAGGWLVVLSVLLLSTAVYAHYLVPVVALAAVAGNACLERAATWLGIGALGAYGVELLGAACGSAWIGSPGYVGLGSLALLLPLAARLGIDTAREGGFGHAADGQHVRR